MGDIDKTLAERGARYGDFTHHGEMTMQMVDVLRTYPTSGYDKAPAAVRLAADVIINKLARAFNGDPLYQDNWHDIIGYAKLVEDRIVSGAFCPVLSPLPTE